MLLKILEILSKGPTELSKTPRIAEGAKILPRGQEILGVGVWDLGVSEEFIPSP
jgi:hypothetical protein